MSTEIVPSTRFHRLLTESVLPAMDATGLDPAHPGDRRIALANAAVETEEEGLVVDLARVGGLMGEGFAIAPIKHCGREIRRRRDISDGEVYFYVGKNLRRALWSMHFEPGVVMGHNPSFGAEVWRTATATIPPVPAAHRPESDVGKFILWEQEWAEKILLPKDPALLEHVVGDVYVVRAVWDLTPLEAAALRGKR